MTTSSLGRLELRRNLLLVGCGFAGLVINGALALANSSTWNVDCNQYYSAGKLLGTGHLYDPDAIRSLELERNVRAVPFGRIPAFAVAFQPLSALPYPVARLLWLCASIAAVAGFAYLWPFATRAWALVAICWSAPIAMCLAIGQDTMWFLFFAALGLRLLLSGHDLWAGIAFSACIAKPHLALLLPVFLIARLKWRALLGGAAGCAASLLVSFAAEGNDWPRRYLSLARIPDFDPAPGRMPNLRGLLSLVDAGLAVEVALGLVVAAALWFFFRTAPLPVAGALVLAGGLLLGHHGYFYDAQLLLPALLLPCHASYIQASYPEWLRKWALFLLSPVPYLFLLIGTGVLGRIAITGYTLTLIAVMMRAVMARQGKAPVTA
jgi:hypothetical protein